MSDDNALRNREHFEPDLHEFRLLSLCSEHLDTIDDLFARCSEKTELAGRMPVLAALLLGVQRTGDATVSLLRSGYTNEAFMLGRALLERVTTLCYLLTCPPDGVQRYAAYGRQKALRMRDRRVRAGSIEYRMKFLGGSSDSPEDQELLAMFTGPKGGEKTRWTELSLTKMIGEIHRVSGAGKMLLITHLALYERGSEALHGTFYGLLVDTPYWEPPLAGSATQEIRQQVGANLGLVAMVISAIVHDLHRHASSIVRAGDLLELSRGLHKSIRETQRRTKGR